MWKLYSNVNGQGVLTAEEVSSVGDTVEDDFCRNAINFPRKVTIESLDDQTKTAMLDHKKKSRDFLPSRENGSCIREG